MQQTVRRDNTGRLERFEDLAVWRRAHELTLEVYRCTGAFPRDEKFGLTSQMRRAAVSVPANIAEGFKKRGGRDNKLLQHRSGLA